LYANNLINLLGDMGGADGFKVDLEDQIIKEMAVLSEGEVKWIPFD